MAATEKQILEAVRKVLAAVVKDTLPPEGMKHPLTEDTIQDIRVCFGMITAREQELMKEAGETPMKPEFMDDMDSQPNNVVSIDSLMKSAPKE